MRIPNVFLLLCVGVVLAAEAAAPTLAEIQNATFRGLSVSKLPVTLTAGKWQGLPVAPGSASRPTVWLVKGFLRTADLTGDVAAESVVALAENAGGTRTGVFLAVVGRKDGKLENLATAFLGDRVEIKSARIDRNRVLLEVVQVGGNDAMCCPGDIVRRDFELAGKQLKQVGAASPAGRLTLDSLAGPTWILKAWDIDAPYEPSEKPISLAYKDGRLAGYAGCNRYFAGAAAGERPGDVKVSGAGATRMACPDQSMRDEDRFLKLLGGVTKFGYYGGQLMLSYGGGAMLFAAE